jgi:hypothetical protein
MVLGATHFFFPYLDFVQIWKEKNESLGKGLLRSAVLFEVFNLGFAANHRKASLEARIFL